MPLVIKHIDEIAREKQRDVLFVVFNEKKEYDSLMDYLSYDYENDPVRIDLMEWLEQNEIPYYPCAHFANENVILPYRGQLYIDIPMDENDEQYLKLKNHLEYEDGKMKIKGITFYVLSLSQAMKNAHHDEDGF